MGYSYSTTRKVDLKPPFNGVTIVLRKMTEGRRAELRKKLIEPNKRIREILREQEQIEKSDKESGAWSKFLELQEQFDTIMMDEVNPAYLMWGVKNIEGLEADQKVLTVEDYLEWPSALFNEVLEAVKGESELSTAERKNSLSDTISGEQAGGNPTPSTVRPAEERGSGEVGTVPSTTLPM